MPVGVGSPNNCTDTYAGHLARTFSLDNYTTFAHFDVATNSWGRPDPRDLVFDLSPRQICRRIQDAAQTAGLKSYYSGHSPRVGMAMDLAAAGCELPVQIPARYTGSETTARVAVFRYYRGMSG